MSGARRRALALAAALALPASAARAREAPQPRALTLAAAVELTLEDSRDIAAAAAGVDAAESRVRGARAQRLPKLGAEANALFWDKELTFDLGGVMLPGLDSTIRDRVTSSLSVTLAQPLTGLLSLSRLVGVEEAGSRVARADADRTRLDAAARTAETYLRVLEARAGLEVAEKSPHTEGQGTFQPPNAWYLGVTLSWDVWDWGKTGAAVDEAAARRRQAELGAAGLGDAVELDVRSRALEAQTAHESLAVSASALQAAEEAYRIQSVRFQNGDATTTDLLDAETAVARARVEVALARYDYFIARVVLSRATGELPDFLR